MKNRAALIVLIMANLLMQTNAYAVENIPFTKPAEAPLQSLAEIPKDGKLIETRQPLSPSVISNGKIADVYKWAAEEPAAFDALYCYCRCKENKHFKHKTLLTCYTDRHAEKCGVCLQEGVMAHELTKRGKKPKEIRVIVDNWFAKKLAERKKQYK